MWSRIYFFQKGAVHQYRLHAILALRNGEQSLRLTVTQRLVAKYNLDKRQQTSKQTHTRMPIMQKNKNENKPYYNENWNKQEEYPLPILSFLVLYN
jgi:hypothetical protein